MEQSQAVSPRQWLWSSTLIWLVAILALTWLLRMNFWSRPFQMDEGVYAYIGWGMFKGLVPYKDIFDHKPPGIYVLYGLSFLLFGTSGVSIKVFGTIYTLGTVLAVFFVARRLAGSTAGCLTALLYAVFSCGPRIEGGGVNTEVFMALPYTLAAYSLLKAVETDRGKHYFLVGVWTGIACTIKQVAVVNLLWVGVYFLFYVWRLKKWNAVTHSVKNGVLVAVGSILPWIPFIFYFYLNEATKEFFFWQVSFNFTYVDVAYQFLPTASLFFVKTISVIKENGPIWLLSLVGIGLLWKKVRDPKSSSESEPGPSPPTVFFLMTSWLLFSFLGTALGGRYYGHYYIQIIPALTVLGGIGLAGVIQEIRARGWNWFRRPVSLVLTAVFACTLLLFVLTYGPYFFSYDGDQISLHQYNTPLFSVTRFIGKYLGEQTQPDDLIYVWRSDPEINFYALRKTPSPFLVHWTLNDGARNAVMRSLERAPPKYIVEMTNMAKFPELQDYVGENYHPETNSELEKLKEIFPFEIYRRKGE